MDIHYRITIYLRERFFKIKAMRTLFEYVLNRGVILKSNCEPVCKNSFINQPQVSVVIATRDNDKTIEKCITSLLNQSHKNLEIVIVNDGSKDLTGSILEAAQKNHENIKVITNLEPVGTSLARNEGINVCTSSFITFQDGDDYSHKHRIKKQLKPLLKNKKIQMSLCSYVRVDAHNRILCINGRRVRRCIISMLSRVEVLHEAGLFKNINLGEDSCLYERVKTIHGKRNVRTINSIMYLASFCQNSRNFKNKKINQLNTQIVYK